MFSNVFPSQISVYLKDVVQALPRSINGPRNKFCSHLLG